MHVKKQRLLTPGPTPLHPRALQAMMGAEIHHRTQDFRNLYSSVLADLKTVLGTVNDVLILASSGTGAMEASITNCFSPGDHAIVCTAGKFGERWIELTQAFGLEVTVVQAPYGQVVAPEALEKALSNNKSPIKGVFVQASESSTGAAHDVRAMGEIIQKAQSADSAKVLFIVDAITGIGTMPLDIDHWGLDIVIGGSQKAFMLPPGLAFLSISPKAWVCMDSAKLPRYYFDLRREKKNAAKGESSWTPATSLILGLAEVLKYILELPANRAVNESSVKGMNLLIGNAQHLAAATREAAQAIGLELFAPDHPSAAVTAIKAPAGLNSTVIVNEFRQRFGSIVADGQSEMQGQIFRIAHLGYFDIADLFALIAELELILHAHNILTKDKLGSGVAAVQQYHAQQYDAWHTALQAKPAQPEPVSV